MVDVASGSGKTGPSWIARIKPLPFHLMFFTLPVGGSARFGPGRVRAWSQYTPSPGFARPSQREGEVNGEATRGNRTSLTSIRTRARLARDRFTFRHPFRIQDQQGGFARRTSTQTPEHRDDRVR